MIYNSVCNAINMLGAECVLTEYNGKGACTVKGILQPIKNRAKESGGIDHTAMGVIDNSDYNFLFNLPDKSISLENASVYVHNKHFWIKEYKIFYFKSKSLYAQATILPYKKE